MLKGMTNPRVNKPTKARWWIKSKNDKRWNDSGAFIYRGMRGLPIEVSVRVEELKVKHGEVPEDLEWGFKLSRVLYFWEKLRGLFARVYEFITFRFRVR